jgi:8-oxo-dGTP diphosphatase
MIKSYVLGFAFDEAKLMVVLIEKQKPEWQKGKLNGVGGKVEPYDKNMHCAMVREFYEETGLLTKEDMWDNFANMHFKDDVMGGSAIVYCFRMFSKRVIRCKTIESEKIIHLDLSIPTRQPIIKNLKVLIPMAMDTDFDFCELNLL